MALFGWSPGAKVSGLCALFVPVNEQHPHSTAKEGHRPGAHRWCSWKGPPVKAAPRIQPRQSWFSSLTRREPLACKPCGEKWLRGCVPTRLSGPASRPGISKWTGHRDHRASASLSPLAGLQFPLSCGPPGDCLDPEPLDCSDGLAPQTGSRAASSSARSTCSPLSSALLLGSQCSLLRPCGLLGLSQPLRNTHCCTCM